MRIGNIYPLENFRVNNQKLIKLEKEMYSYKENPEKTLDEEQKAVCYDSLSKSREYSFEGLKEAFRDGGSTGVKNVVEALITNEKTTEK